MSLPTLQLLFYSLIPFFGMSLGGSFVFIKEPNEKFTSIVQHFAAGVVFAAVAVELLPQIIKQQNIFLVIGFGLGVVMMLLVNWGAGKLQASKKLKFELPVAMLFAIAIDVFIDGILVGAAYLANSRSGLIIASALTLEVVFLGLASTATIIKSNVSTLFGILVIISIALLIPIGAMIGYETVSHLSQSAHLMILSFGVAALLYLVTEELLIEAHKAKESTFATVMFFVGFLLILFIS